MKGERDMANQVRGRVQPRTVAEVLAEPDRWYLVSDRGLDDRPWRRFDVMRATLFTDPHPPGGGATLAHSPSSMVVLVVEIPESDR